MRTVAEWTGAHDDQAIPLRVKQRVFERDGRTCVFCMRPTVGKLRPECDHKIALINGGAHRESNFQTLCHECHATKSKADVKEKSKVARVAKKHLGLVKKSNQWPTGKDKAFKSKIGGGIERR